MGPRPGIKSLKLGHPFSMHSTSADKHPPHPSSSC